MWKWNTRRLDSCLHIVLKNNTRRCLRKNDINRKKNLKGKALFFVCTPLSLAHASTLAHPPLQTQTFPAERKAGSWKWVNLEWLSVLLWASKGKWQRHRRVRLVTGYIWNLYKRASSWKSVWAVNSGFLEQLCHTTIGDILLEYTSFS